MTSSDDIPVTLTPRARDLLLNLLATNDDERHLIDNGQAPEKDAVPAWNEAWEALGGPGRWDEP